MSMSVSRVNLNSKSEAMLDKQLDSYSDELAARLNLSNEEFQQLRTKNQTLKLRNDIVNDILTFDHNKDNFMDTKFRDRVYRLRALMTLDPEPKWQLSTNPRGGYWHPTNIFNFD